MQVKHQPCLQVDGKRCCYYQQPSRDPSRLKAAFLAPSSCTSISVRNWGSPKWWEVVAEPHFLSAGQTSICTPEVQESTDHRATPSHPDLTPSRISVGKALKMHLAFCLPLSICFPFDPTFIGRIFNEPIRKCSRLTPKCGGPALSRVSGKLPRICYN